MKYFALLSIGLLWASCANNADDESPAVGIDPAMIHRFDHPNFPLILLADSNEYPKLTITWNETFGRMEVHDDRGLSFFVMEDSTSCTAKKEEIEAGIFQIDYLIESDTTLAYKSSLPDGSEAYHHIFACIRFENVPYTIESDPLVSYNESQQKRILRLIDSLRPLSSLKISEN